MVVVNRLIVNKQSLNNFETTYNENYKRMFRIALKMINNEDDVYDILQDIFTSFYQKTQNGIKIIQPERWLIKATINKCIDYSKSRKRFTKLENIEPTQIIDDIYDKKQEKTIINYALSKLKPKEKTLALLYNEGMSYKEISEISGVKFSSVGKILSRAITKLDKIFKNLNYEMY